MEDVKAMQNSSKMSNIPLIKFQQDMIFEASIASLNMLLLYIWESIKIMLEECSLWYTSGLSQACEKQKYLNYEAITNCKSSVEKK